MIVWIFVAIALGGGAAAALVENMRTATLSLWIASLAVGGVYLTLGAEALAIVQWIVSTLAAISFIFFAAMFGEYDRATSEERVSSSGGPWMARLQSISRAQIVAFGLSAVIGIAFVLVVWQGSADLPEGTLAIPDKNNDLIALGRVLIDHHLLSLEVLATTLFLVLVGGGIIARPEASSGETQEKDASC